MSDPSWEQADPTFPYLDEQEQDEPVIITCSGGATIPFIGGSNG